MKKILCLMLAMIMCLYIVGCGNINNKTVDGGETFEVIETLTMGEETLKFDYSDSANCVTITSKENPDELQLFYVNRDGAITTYCIIDKSGYQYTLFEEKSDGYPITTYNDAGYPRSVEYDNLMVTYEYNNYIDNKLTRIVYSEWSNFSGWEDEDDAQITCLGDYDDKYTGITYTKTGDSRYKMFGSVEWILSMANCLDCINES